MRKIAFITAVLAALAVAAPASGALLAKSCGNSCATLTASGKGNLGVVGSGAEWGSFSSGVVWVRDRTGKDQPQELGERVGAEVEVDLAVDGWRAKTTKPTHVLANGKFWVKLQGTVHPGDTACSTAPATSRASARTRSKATRSSWPSANRALTF